MMRVLHVVFNLKVGGLEKFLVEMIRNYSSDVETYVVCLEEAGELARLVQGNVLVLNEKPGLKFASVPKMVSIIKENGIDLLHTHNESTHIYGSLAGVIAGVPVIHTRHGRYLHDSRRKILLSMISSFLSSRIVGVSEDVTQMMRTRERIPQRKLVTVVNGVDVAAFAPGPRKNVLPEAGRRESVRIGMVARLDAVKDHLSLLRACDIIRKETPDFVLFIVGDGPMRPQLEAETERLRLKDRVVFTGTRHDIADLLNELDIFTLTSTSEGISITLLESMSCSLPVVATDVGGNPEVVVDGETGFLVPPRNPEVAAEKLLKLIRDKELRRRIGEAGRERVMQKFSIARTVARYEELYRELLEGKGR